jgi:hypothetical protein
MLSAPFVVLARFLVILGPVLNLAAGTMQGMSRENSSHDGSAGRPAAQQRARLPRRVRWGAVVALMLLSPFCAEYLIGYQGVITDPFGMLVAVLMVLPIYGAPAVLIREFVRRTGRGWPTMLLLAAAAGLIQAGLIDQSLFNHDLYGGTPELRIPGLDVDAGELLTYIGGHIVWSFGAPIAVIESCLPAAAQGATPARLPARPGDPRVAEEDPRIQPWLEILGLIVVAVIYGAGAIFYYYQLVVAVGFAIRPMQLIAVLVVTGLLVGTAIRWPGRGRSTGAVMSPMILGTVVCLLALGFVLLDDVLGWIGFGLRLLVVVVAIMVLTGCSRRSGWHSGHVLAAASAALLVYTAVAFWVNPENVARSTLYVARGVVAVGMVALLGFAAWRRVRVDRSRS